MSARVLVIDDDRLQFRLLQAHFRSFQRGSYELDWAETYEDGLAKLLAGGYAVCILDFRLGERDGLQLIREAVGQGCRIPIVFLTAESSSNVDIQAMEAGALDYLVKGEISPRSLERSLRYAQKLGDTLEQLRRMATRDQLTGLLNRREYERIIAEEEDRARRSSLPLSLVILDLDRFKSINDTHGHAAGDDVLRESAQRVGHALRSFDRTFRMGGEEFAVVLAQTGPEAALEIARRALGAIGGSPILVGGTRPLTVTASAGVATLPDHALNPTELFSAADRALYLAKAGGRNRAVGAGETSAGP
jgi:diguanylate cyclase (GGDEF)-like protein